MAVAVVLVVENERIVPVGNELMVHLALVKNLLSHHQMALMLLVLLLTLVTVVITVAVLVVLVVGNERIVPVENERMVYLALVKNLLYHHQMKHRQLRLIQLLETLVRMDDSVNTFSQICSISSLEVSLTPRNLRTQLGEYDATFHCMLELEIPPSK